MSALVIAGGCSKRPDERAAQTWFEEKCPACQVVAVQIVEDEVVARTFEVSFEAPDGEHRKLLLLYFPRDETWSLPLEDRHQAPWGGGTPERP